MIHKFLLLFIASSLFVACGDESPMSAANNEISEKEKQHEQEQKEREQEIQRQKEACYYGTSNNSASWCCSNFGYQCNTTKSSSSAKSSSSYKYSSSSRKHSSSSTISYYYSSSSKTSSNTKKSYLTQSKNLKLTLTYFKQETPDWDNTLSMKNYADADPRISFKIQFRKNDGTRDSVMTENLLEKQDTGEWEGRIDFTTTVPIYTDSIYVFPRITDADLLINDDYSSGYGYGVHSIGYIKDYEVWDQTDEENKQCTLKWEWYLY